MQFCIFLIQIIQATETGQIHAGFSGTGFVWKTNFILIISNFF